MAKRQGIFIVLCTLTHSVFLSALCTVSHSIVRTACEVRSRGMNGYVDDTTLSDTTTLSMFERSCVHSRRLLLAWEGSERGLKRGCNGTS